MAATGPAAGARPEPGRGPDSTARPGGTAGPGAGFGLFDRVRRMLATLVTLAHTRRELVTVELEEEVQRLTRVVLYALVGLFCAGVAVVMLATTVIIAFWEHRVLAALLVTAAFVGGAIVAGLAVRRRLAERPRFLGATLAELQRDARALGGE
ncbi:MAG: phage holin family protein [Pseudomonadota bacterium]